MNVILSTQNRSLYALMVIGLAQLVSWTGLQLTPTLGGPVIVGLTGSPAFGGLPYGVAFLSAAVAASLAARVVSRFGVEAVLRAGALLGALGTGLAALGEPLNSPIPLVAGVAIEGLGLGWCWITRYEAARLLGPARWNLALGLVVGTAGLGATSGPLTIPLLKEASAVVGLAASTLPWLGATALFLMLVAFASFVTIAPERPPPPSTPPQATVPLAWAFLPSMLVLALVHSIMAGVMGVVPAVLSKGEVPGFSLALIMSAHFFGMFCLAPVLSFRLKPSGTPYALGLACIVMAVSAFSLAIAEHPLAVGAAMWGVGLGWSLAFLSLTIQIAYVDDPVQRRALQSRNDMLTLVLGGSAPILAGLALVRVGFNPLMLILSSIGLLALLLVLGRRVSPQA